MLQFVFVVVMLLAAPGIGNAAQRSDRIDALRQVAASVGHVIGAASACREISQPRIKAMTDKLSDLINASTANDEEFSSMRQAYDQSTVEGQRTVTSKQTDCAAADRDLADMESIVTSQPRAAATTGDAPSAATKTSLPRRGDHRGRAGAGPGACRRAAPAAVAIPQLGDPSFEPGRDRFPVIVRGDQHCRHAGDHRPGDRVWSLGAALRIRQGTRPPDEDGHRDRLQPCQ